MRQFKLFYAHSRGVQGLLWALGSMLSLNLAVMLSFLSCIVSSELTENIPKSFRELAGNHQTFTNLTLHSENTRYFDSKYFSTLDYSYLKGQALLSVPKPWICERQTKPFGCKMYNDPIQLVNVTHLLATRIAVDYVSKEFPIYNMISLFDWIIVSQRSSAANMGQFIVNEDGTYWFGQSTQPRTIFVENFAIPYFVESIFPNISNRFVLYSGHNDFTVPYNVDARWQYDSGVYQSAWDTLLASDNVIHWFTENHVVSHPKVSTMPIGMNPREGHPDDLSDHPINVEPLEKRPLKLLQLDKVRAGEQWVQRKIVHDLCVRQPEVCFAGGVKTDEHGRATHKLFAEQVSAYPFLLCVHGGGLDPSPKAWEAILIGTIPIIEHTPLDDAYSLLPVAYVHNITDFMLWKNKTEVMRQWINRLGPHYQTGSKLRSEVLYKLTTKYWWGRVVSHLNHTIHSYSSLKFN